MEERPPVAEVLDLGVVGDDAGNPSPPPRARISRRAALVTLAGGAAAAGLLATRSEHRPAPPAPPSAVTHTRLGGGLRGVATGWQLFGLAEDAVVRLDVGSGAVTRTDLPPLGDGQVFVVPGRDRVYVRSLGAPTGWLVRDDEPASPLAPSLAGVGALLPGPDPDHLWMHTQNADADAMVLVDADGWGSLPLRVPVPEFATTGPMTDGGGGLLFEGVGGLYRISPAGRLAISDAIVLAVGQGDLLTLAKGAGGSWRPTLELRGGASEPLPVPIGPQLPHGILAPDASSVVLYAVDERRQMSLVVVDLPRGEHRPLEVDVGGVAGDGTVVWTPDGGRILCVDTDGRLRVVDPSSGAVTDSPALPPLSRLAVRAFTS